MSKRDLQNKKFERIEPELFQATRASDEEIEESVGNPFLFDSIKTRIEREERRRAERAEKRLPAFAAWLLRFGKHRAAFAGLLFIVLLGGLFAAFRFAPGSSQSGEFIAADRLAREKSSVRPADPARADVGNTKFGQSESETETNQQNQINREDQKIQSVRETNFISGSKNKPAKKAFSSVSSASSASSARSVGRNGASKISKKSSSRTGNRPDAEPAAGAIAERSAMENEEPQKVFFSLPFSENKPVEDEGLQIVRAELSRSELFALGVDLPLENGVSKIRTELLVGVDGIARAIRVVEDF